jgi:hypothetical protein
VKERIGQRDQKRRPHRSETHAALEGRKH